MVCGCVVTAGVVGAGEVDRHIGESLGSLFAGMLTTTLKGSVWFKVKILGRDPMELAAQVGAGLKPVRGSNVHGW